MKNIKILVVGPPKVGKSSFIKQYGENSSEDEPLFILGSNLIHKDYITTQQEKVRISVFEVNEFLDHLHNLDESYKNADGLIIVVSLNDKDTFTKLNIEGVISNFSNPNLVTVLVGNKSDLNDQIILEDEEIKEEIEKYGIRYFETSAKKNQDVVEVFTYLVDRIIGQ